MERCSWAEGSDAYRQYHDTEWGVPSHNDRHLFELLILEGAQAGLSWSTILNRREGYRTAYAGFDPVLVAAFTEADKLRLLADAGIVRNKAKVEASVQNAQCFLKVVEERGSFDRFVWSFVDGRPVQNAWSGLGEVPAVDSVAEALSKELRRRGFGFVGPTIIYAYMQAVGMVNDHLTSCFRHAECAALA